MSKKRIALIINIIILTLTLLSFAKTFFLEHSIAVEYYTNDSNILALISSLLFIIFYKNINENIADYKDFVKDIRYLATSCLTVTFLVVVFVLCPMYSFNYKLLMFTDIYLVFHTIVPILSIFSYIVLENGSSKKYLCLIFTMIYAIILIILNILNLIKGPYPFLMVTTQNPLVTILWGIIIIGGSHIIEILVNRLNKKIKKGANKV